MSNALTILDSELPVPADPHTTDLRDLLLNNLLESGDIGILLLSDFKEERFVSIANRYFCELFRFSPEKIIGLSAQQLAAHCTPYIAQEHTPTLLNNALMAKGGQQISEITLLKPRKQILKQTSLPAKNDSGEICGRLIIYKNVTENREEEDQTLRRQKMESIGTLAGGIAHDFNNILTAIFGYTCSLMNDLPENTAALEKLQQIEKSANRAAELTNNLLAFSRKNPYIPEPVNLSQLCENTANMLMFALPTGIHLEVKTAENIPYVEADATQIQQVLSQLTINARDAIIGEGHIKISTRIGHDSYAQQSEKPNGTIRYAVIDVEDNGIGVPKDSINRIFEPFYTTKPPGRGVGLGLSMVYGVVKQHRGFIEVESAPNQGSRFSVYLPIMKEQPEQETQVSPITVPAKKIEACVMIVDDEADLRNICHDTLQEIVTEVVVARDGLEALQYFRMRKGAIDLILLDLTMPVMNGKDCFLEMQEINPEVRVIICSGYAEEMGASELIQKGALGFIQKPYALSVLVKRVIKALEPLAK